MKTHKLLTIALLTWDRRKDMMYLFATFHLTLISNSRLSDNVNTTMSRLMIQYLNMQSLSYEMYLFTVRKSNQISVHS
jgi:methylglyoxal synthase